MFDEKLGLLRKTSEQIPPAWAVSDALAVFLLQTLYLWVSGCETGGPKVQQEEGENYPGVTVTP